MIYRAWLSYRQKSFFNWLARRSRNCSYSFITALFIIVISFNSFAITPSLRDKIGQMLIVGFQGTVVDEHSLISQSIAQDNIGGVILFDYNEQLQTYGKNIKNPQQLKKLTHKLQQLTQKYNKMYHRANLPLYIAIDYEGGKVNRLHPRYGFPEIPSAKSIGLMTFDEAKKNAQLMAKTLAAMGINLDFAPDVDVDINPDNSIISKLGRSFSTNPNTVTQYASLFSNQFLSNGIECTYKHFPGHGNSIADSHVDFVDITNTWSEQELLPYLQALIQPEHCHLIMVAHVINRKLDVIGNPATLSYPVITGLLRHDLKFEGVIITDDLQMKAITNYYGVEKAMVLAINAGADMLIFGNQLTSNYRDPKELIDIIEQKVRSGEISEQRIDDAYRRIVAIKRMLR